MRSFLYALGFMAVATVTSTFAGCGSHPCQSSFGCGESPDGNATDAPLADTNPFGFMDTGNGDGSSCQLHCSGDLHDVLDCNNNVVTTCGPDEGCGGSGCVSACDAAKANKSSVGCDYYSIDPDIISAGTGACFAAYVANTWNAPVGLTVTWGTQSLNVSQIARIPSGNGQAITYAPLTGGMLQPGQVAILFLARYGSVLTNCPAGITPGVTVDDAATHGTGIGTAFHIVADHPVVAYDIFPYGGGQSAATSATLLIPSSAWDVNYIGVNAYRPDQAVPEAQNFLEILANQNNTQVTINPVAAIVGGTGVAAGPAHAPTTYTLQAGQYLQLEQATELTGSVILANVPVSVWGAATCLNVNVTDIACDSAHQEFLPVSAMGHEYVGVRYRNRGTGPDETPPWRLVGAVDGTTLTYDPSAPTGAPPSLNRGQVAEFNSAGPFVVSSQDAAHPFYISAHMTGGATVTPSGRGDPEFVNVVPPAEYLPSYVFFTDPTYSETNLVLVRQKGASGFADVNLDCAGVLTGWQPVGSGGKYEYTRQDLVTGNFQQVGMCNNGLHTITSTEPFGLTVWGWGQRGDELPDDAKRELRVPRGCERAAHQHGRDQSQRELAEVASSADGALAFALCVALSFVPGSAIPRARSARQPLSPASRAARAGDHQRRAVPRHVDLRARTVDSPRPRLGAELARRLLRHGSVLHPERLLDRVDPPLLDEEPRHAEAPHPAVLPPAHLPHVPVVLRRADGARVHLHPLARPEEAPLDGVRVPHELHAARAVRRHHVLGMVARARRAVLPRRAAALLPPRVVQVGRARLALARLALGERARRASLHLLFPQGPVDRSRALRRALFPDVHALRHAPHGHHPRRHPRPLPRADRQVAADAPVPTARSSRCRRSSACGCSSARGRSCRRT